MFREIDFEADEKLSRLCAVLQKKTFLRKQNRRLPAKQQQPVTTYFLRQLSAYTSLANHSGMNPYSQHFAITFQKPHYLFKKTFICDVS